MPRLKKQVLKQRADGRYCCKYHGIQFFGKTSDEALTARDEYKNSIVKGGYYSDVSFKEYSEKWLASYKSHLTTGPYNTHVRMLNRFMDTTGGDLPLRDVTPSDIAKFYQQFAGKSLSTIHSARDSIRGVFKAALADDIVQKDPTYNVPLPKGEKGTHREITSFERDLIHKAEHRMQPAVMTMLYAGLRRGEVMALNVPRDVDFKEKTITVREAVRFDSAGKPVIVKPKTRAGIRTVPLLDGLSEVLHNIRDMVCVSADGQMMTESAWERAWESYLYTLGELANGCSKRWAKKSWKPVSIRPHDLRHSYCTMLYDAGVDLKTAMLWMGHADQTMTLRIYTHLTETRKKSAENALREATKSVFGMQNGMQTEDDPAKRQ